MSSGQIEGIYIAAEAEQLPRAVESVRAVAGRGLEGDRNFVRKGTFSPKQGTGKDLTLIEAEALEALEAEAGIELSAAASRRNLLTRGIALNDLVGKRFKIGDVECEGMRLCDPCDHLQRITEPGVLKGLVDRGGLRADILVDGEIAVGDELRPAP